MSKTAVLICPGRGTYNKPELGVLGREHPEAGGLLADFDARRAALGQKRLTSLDSAARFSQNLHTRGDNASALIYAAIRVAARNFAPDVFIITGPGTTLGGAVAQALIAINWMGLDSKESFQRRQQSDPVLLSMGRAEDRRAVAAGLT